MRKKTKITSKDSQRRDQRMRVLQALLLNIPFDGWTETAFAQAVKQTGLSRGEVDLLFPQGVRDVIELFGDLADEAMQNDMAAEPGFRSMRVRDKITFAVRARLEFWQPHREAVRRMMYWYALPFHLPLGLKRIYKTVDVMWRAAGDTATDFNFYTKRALLAGVLKATILFWLDDETPGCVASWDFLDRRIGDIMKMGKTISLMKEWKPAEVVKMMKSRFTQI